MDLADGQRHLLFGVRQDARREGADGLAEAERGVESTVQPHVGATHAVRGGFLLTQIKPRAGAVDPRAPRRLQAHRIAGARVIVARLREPESVAEISAHVLHRFLRVDAIRDTDT